MKGRILLVEDNPSDAKLARLAFKRGGIFGPIDVIRDGCQVLDYLLCTGRHSQRAGELPALTLLDLNLPCIDGFEVLRRIRAEPRVAFMPVIVLTSSLEFQDLSRGYELGANAYVQKPVDFERFIDAARALGNFWLMLNRSPSNLR